MRNKINEDKPILSPRHLMTLLTWAKLIESNSLVWTKHDAELALRIEAERKRLLNLQYKNYGKRTRTN